MVLFMTDPLMIELGRAAYDERFRELQERAKMPWKELPAYAQQVWIAVAQAVIAKQAELHTRDILG
jgi:hypothetical protein